jgi:hypothetical protein
VRSEFVVCCLAKSEPAGGDLRFTRRFPRFGYQIVNGVSLAGPGSFSRTEDSLRKWA